MTGRYDKIDETIRFADYYDLILFGRTINFSITPKEYNVNSTETVYKTLSNLNQNTPENEPNKEVISTAGSLYGETGEISVSRIITKTGETEKRELQNIVLTQGEKVVTIDLSKKANGTYRYSPYTVTITNNTVTTRYPIEDNLSIQTNYVMYKLIHGEN